jgi:SAM-dependent methyltransferase
VKDYADWLTPERLAVEEAAWAQSATAARYAAGVRRLVLWNGVHAVTEFGCGTGLVPQHLDDLAAADQLMRYVLVDRNEGCLAKARERNAGRLWWVEIEHMDIRDLHPMTPLVCGFATLKHFALDEWENVFARLFARAQFGLFTVALSGQAHEDGVEYTHTWLDEGRLADALRRVSHHELWREHFVPGEPLIATARFAQ